MLTLQANQDWIIANTQTATTGAAAPLWLNSAMPAADDRHEAVMFLKPEVTMLGTNKLPAFLKLVDDLCAKFNVDIMNVGALSWQYLGQYGIINDHYGVMGKLAAEGMKALTPDVQQKAREAFPGMADADFVGGLQFLQMYPDMTAEKLGALWEQGSTKKLAPGTHSQQIDYNGKSHVVFVGFFPNMAAHFTRNGRTILVMPVRSKTAWATLRDTMIGATNPEQAEAGSLRNLFLTQKETLGLPVVDTGNNGVHLSAGPLEGMVELMRFTSNRATGTTVAAEATNFGAAWLAAGGATAELQTLCSNPLVNAGGKTQSAFDATELMDMADAVATLRTALKQAA